MKTIPIALKAEMTGELAHLATCMRIERQDGEIFGFTTHDRPLVVGGVTYEPAASFNPTNVASGHNLDVDNLTVEGILASDTITEDDLRAGRWDWAEFRIFMVNWNDLGMGEWKIRKGHLGEVTVYRQTFQVELLGMMEAYSISIVEITTPGCRASLGDARCKVVMTGYTHTGTIDSSDTDYFTLHDLSRTEPDGYFDEGVITFTSGALDGMAFEVKAYIVGTWFTKTPFPYDAAGLTYTMTRGCNRHFGTCRDTFNNAVNFRGEPWLRGNDALVQIGRHT